MEIAILGLWKVGLSEVGQVSVAANSAEVAEQKARAYWAKADEDGEGVADAGTLVYLERLDEVVV